MHDALTSPRVYSTGEQLAFQISSRSLLQSEILGWSCTIRKGSLMETHTISALSRTSLRIAPRRRIWKTDFMRFGRWLFACSCFDDFVLGFAPKFLPLAGHCWKLQMKPLLNTMISVSRRFVLSEYTNISIVPVIVVLTQFDIFVRSIQSPPEDDDDYGDIEEALGYDDDFMAAGSSTAAGDSSLDQSSRLKADEELKERFVKPLIGENVHWVRVSGSRRFSSIFHLSSYDDDSELCGYAWWTCGQDNRVHRWVIGDSVCHGSAAKCRLEDKGYNWVSWIKICDDSMLHLTASAKNVLPHSTSNTWFMSFRLLARVINEFSTSRSIARQMASRRSQRHHQARNTHLNEHRIWSSQQSMGIRSWKRTLFIDAGTN